MKRILIQLDTDRRASVFDRVVALDAGADVVMSHGAVSAEEVTDIVYGAIFTRGPDDLHHTAIFVGGSDIDLGEGLVRRAERTFLGPLRVSVMLDSSGANTTAAAAVHAVTRHAEVSGGAVLVLGGTGAVGRRVARLLAGLGARVRLGSRSIERAREAARRVSSRLPGSTGVEPVAAGDPAALRAALDGVIAVVSAGAPGAELLPLGPRREAGTLRVAVDLNAVPPAGIEGIDVQDRAVERDGVVAYGAIGIGRIKMKIHKAAIARLFESKELTLDAEEIFDIGKGLGIGGEKDGRKDL